MWRLRFDFRLVHVGSVADKVTLRKIFPKYYVISVFSLHFDQPLLHKHLSLALIFIYNQQLTLLPKLTLFCQYLTFRADLILQVLWVNEKSYLNDFGIFLLAIIIFFALHSLFCTNFDTLHYTTPPPLTLKFIATFSS